MEPTPKLKKYGAALVVVVVLLLGVAVVVATNYQSFFHPYSSTSGVADTKLDKDIATAEAQIATHPVVTKPYIGLASLYLQKIRETSDSSYYAKIDTLMNEAGKIDPHDGDVPAIRASVAMGRHDFQNGKVYITQAIALNQNVAAYYGLNGDADIELGAYQDAVDSFQKMVDLRPDFSSWSRIAYIRELYGDIPGAKVALNEAISSGSNYPENIAWAYVERGKLELRDAPDVANQSFNAALNVLPTYTQAMEGLGRVAFAKNDLPGAEKEFTAAYTGLPLAQYAIDLGDLYASENNMTKANQEYALAQAAFDTSIKGGVDTDLEESLFLSDHDLNLSTALAMATRAREARPSEYGEDYYAWALFKNGNVSGAAALAEKAFPLGKIDPLILFHQGMIALANKDMVHAKEFLAKAYALNPNLTVQDSSILKSTLATLK